MAAQVLPGINPQQMREERERLIFEYTRKKAEKEEQDEKAFEGAQKMREERANALDVGKYKDTTVGAREQMRRHILSMSLFPNIYNRNMVMKRF